MLSALAPLAHAATSIPAPDNLTLQAQEYLSRVRVGSVGASEMSEPAGRRNLYVGNTNPADPILSPVFADYGGLPPLLIQAATGEILLSDSARIAQRARAGGIDVTLDIWDGMWHGWHDTPGLSEAEQDCTRIAEFFLTHLSPSSDWRH